MKKILLVLFLLGAFFARAADAPALPRLIELGADKCIPCKAMKPIIDELTKEYAGQLDVVFIDVWKDRAAGERHGIQSIPTQIFLRADGKEAFRHEGFFAKKDILAKWKELGVELKPKPAAPTPTKAKPAAH
ncbi:MAG: thioredoxin family protein [Opitutae bacterium]|nr:thioredoxin family protein [Opitutae bacterium]